MGSGRPRIDDAGRSRLGLRSHIRGAGGRRPGGQRRYHRQCPGRPADARAVGCRGCAGAAGRPRRRHRHARRRNQRGAGARQSERGEGCRLAGRARRLRALYFTRATAPSGEGPLYHHIGLYAYRRAALARFVGLPPSPLERREKLEQLRALEAGMRIDVSVVASAPLGVDTPDDLERARALLARNR